MIVEITKSAQFSHLLRRLYSYVPGTILDAWDITVKNQVKPLPPWGLHLSGETDNKERNEKIRIVCEVH